MKTRTRSPLYRFFCFQVISDFSVLTGKGRQLCPHCDGRLWIPPQDDQPTGFPTTQMPPKKEESDDSAEEESDDSAIPQGWGKVLWLGTGRYFLRRPGSGDRPFCLGGESLNRKQQTAELNVTSGGDACRPYPQGTTLSVRLAGQTSPPSSPKTRLPTWTNDIR